MEDRKGIVLQAHMDMVPQKNNDKKHDFTKDPIETRIVHQDDGDWVYANGTTLGADDGLGVAAAMSVLESKTLKHGPLEALFTVDEETRMVGAKALKPGVLKGEILLNLDSETEGELYVGCAGGLDANVTFKYKEAPMPKGYKAFQVIVTGLRGGHSGMEINEGRGNANKVMARVLLPMVRHFKGKLVSFNGGNMRNAIPFKAEVVLTLPKENVDDLKQTVADWKELLIDEFKGIESGIEFYVEDVETPKTEVPEEIQDNLINAIHACHDGVVRMIPSYPDVVETSSNLAIIDIENGKAALKILARSSREDMKDYIVDTLDSCFSMAGMKVETAGSYGGWDPNPDSEILNLLLKEYKELFGEDGIVQVDHAGLECSVILGKYPWLDVVSLGPTMKSPHTTTERALIKTVEPFWTLLKKTLEDIPVK
jgi:aminoacyl-histidine dipeptidase